ncbi:Glyoxalase/bleomycin resistance protein/dioxygenase [Rhizobium sp. PDO1-076]|uniref:VOC family protein n=1 Tax=Rhizobium sp. PDO1-076 TaxID=1125979 RepID=UPI00024E2A0C|nr:VOC family protein [Rhizobium sp. PDO1-076]EHS49274.1 Glyoxalase/bleomycin resistance protein/dioxygenase [Rhizobium sp. PDO1-076]
MTSGLHHITAITRKIQANVDFYLGFLGLRLVKRTGGFEDAAQLHLFYGDATASAGSLVSFLAWEDGAPGRVGHGAPSEISFAIEASAIGFWLTRALQFGIKASGPSLEFGEPVLRLTDPDGIIVKLVGVAGLIPGKPWLAPGIAAKDAIIGLRGATLLSEHPAETAGFLIRYGDFAESASEGAVTRLASGAGQIIDIRDVTGFWPAIPGTGMIDHIALRLPDQAGVDRQALSLVAEGHGNINVHDRKYFYSLYVREPAGSLIELASDGPGFDVDEPMDRLGEQLFIPEHFKLANEDITPMLPQFGLPGEPRIIYRDLPFVHRLHEPEMADGSTLILLHGTGGNEADLLPFGRKLGPDALLIGLRGRSTEEGVARFFRRFSELTFDQKDIRSEAEALSAFVDDAVPAYDLDRQDLTLIGYSNGANMLAAAMLLHPGIATTSVLLRPMRVLEETPDVRLPGSRVLIVSGKEDPYAEHALALADQLRSVGAKVSHRVIPAGHALVAADIDVAQEWLADGAQA